MKRYCSISVHIDSKSKECHLLTYIKICIVWNTLIFPNDGFKISLSLSDSFRNAKAVGMEHHPRGTWTNKTLLAEFRTTPGKRKGI